MLKNLIDQDHIRFLVKSHLANAKKKNPLFSLRAFAKKVSISAGGLSSFLAGKTDYSLEMLEKLVYETVSSPEERKDILQRYNTILIEQLRDLNKRKTIDSRVLRENEISFIQDWYHYALLFLIRTKDFKLDILWISKRLGISTGEVEAALSRLITLNLIKLNQDQTVALLENTVRTSDDVSSRALRIMHKQMLSLAAESIDHVPVHLRDITSITLPIDVSNLGKAKEIIRKCQDDLMTILPGSESTEVYQLLFCLYPVSKKEEGI